MSQPAFDFGQNWKEFSEHALDPVHYAQAKAHFADLMQRIPLEGMTFLDVGFGQGLSLLCAAAAGARAHGLDINPKCREVFLANASQLESSVADAKIVVGSVLDAGPLATVRAWAPGGYDVVHSWGVLHHTGAMWKAIENAASLVGHDGYLVLAIYNRHWTSPLWTIIKRVYVASPKPVQQMLNWLFVPVIYLAKLASTRRNPLRMERGMDFFYNVVDWIGGYPYEYASRREIEQFVAKLGFVAERFVPAIVPIGCNEFVFRRT